MNWETVNPEKWIPEGYAVAKIDSRGCGRSEGGIDNWTIREAEDYAECIEKIAALPWCDGNMAGLEISYFAIMQWAVAALCPPHLKAIIPFEGACDLCITYVSLTIFFGLLLVLIFGISGDISYLSGWIGLRFACLRC